MDFKKQCPTKKDASGKSVKAYYVDAVKIEGFEQQRKGGTTFRVPKFGLAPLSEDTNKQAIAIDGELQAFLADYLKRPRAEAATTTATEQPPTAGAKKPGRFDDMEDDVPPAWTDDEVSRAKAAEEEVPF
jgi:hypothetical protein